MYADMIYFEMNNCKMYDLVSQFQMHQKSYDLSKISYEIFAGIWG